MATLVDQQTNFFANMQNLTEVLVAGRGANDRARRQGGRQATAQDDGDAMDVDADPEGGDLADDEQEPLPVRIPGKKKPFKLTSLPVRRDSDENSLKVCHSALRTVSDAHTPLDRLRSGR